MSSGISERRLRKWRREALINVEDTFGYGPEDPAAKTLREAQERILLLTAELLDRKLLEGGRK